MFHSLETNTRLQVFTGGGCFSLFRLHQIKMHHEVKCTAQHHHPDGQFLLTSMKCRVPCHKSWKIIANVHQGEMNKWSYKSEKILRRIFRSCKPLVHESVGRIVCHELLLQLLLFLGLKRLWVQLWRETCHRVVRNWIQRVVDTTRLIPIPLKAAYVVNDSLLNSNLSGKRLEKALLILRCSRWNLLSHAISVEVRRKREAKGNPGKLDRIITHRPEECVKSPTKREKRVSNRSAGHGVDREKGQRELWWVVRRAERVDPWDKLLTRFVGRCCCPLVVTVTSGIRWIPGTDETSDKKHQN